MNKKFADHGPNTCAPSPEDDERWLVNWYRNEHRWLNQRVEELTRQLRLRTIMLAGALALSTLVVVGTFCMILPYEPEPSTTSLIRVTPRPDPTDSPSPLAGKREHPLEVERSQPLVPASERIGALQAADARYRAAMADLDHELRRAEALSEQLLASSRGEDSKALIPGAGGGREIFGAGNDVGAPDPRHAPLETVENSSPGEHGSGGARGFERTYYTALNFVNLRVAPNTSARVFAVVEQGQLVRRIGRERGWLKVEYGNRSARNVTGWVHGNYLRRVEAPFKETGPAADR